MTQYATINTVTPGGIRIEPYIAPGFDIHPAFMQRTIKKLTPTQQRQLAYVCIAAKSAESLPTLFL